MCGIAGATGDQGGWIEGATRCIEHRGPDRSSIYRDADVQLGHARLAIIDLSPEADQPMFSSDGAFAVVFNGEIYNFQECRTELEAQGVTFSTRSDTEVLLKLYERHGEDCLDRLRGMFAFAIWDKQRRRLFVARDRMGEKPLYYARLPDGNLLFASEIKAILSHPAIGRTIDPLALDEYLSYLYIPAPRTIFKDVAALPPGHSITWQAREHQVRRFWRLPPLDLARHEPGEIEHRAYALFQRSVGRTLIADVPVGVFLSGGIDSASIVAVASQQTPHLKTFTVVFDAEGAQYDERAPAKAIAEHFGTDHHELRVSADSSSLLPAIVRHFDQPFGNPTALLTYQLSAEARKFVTVAIGGDGGDEVFGGYPRYRGIRLAERFSAVPVGVRRGAALMSAALPESQRGRHTLRRVREFLGSGTMDPVDQYRSWVGYFDRTLKDSLYAAPFRSIVEDNDGMFLRRMLDEGETPVVDRAIRADLQSFLPFNVLEYGDKMSMAHGLEVRLPFLDTDLVSLMASTPASVKMPGGASKHVLKAMMAGRLPDSVLTRKKMGFNPPMGVWIDRELKSRVHEYLGEAQVRARGYFEPAAIGQMIAQHRSGRRDYSLHLWSLLVLEEWHRQYLN